MSDTLLLKDNQQISIVRNSNDIKSKTINVIIKDMITGDSIDIAEWDGSNWSGFHINKLFLLAKQYPGLRRLIKESQLSPHIITTSMQIKCLTRKILIQIHKLSKKF